MIAIIALFGRQCLIMALITLAEYRLIELSLWLLLSYFRLLLPYYGSCRFIRYYGLTLTDYRIILAIIMLLLAIITDDPS